MTENEILNYLRENKHKGVIFDFMPEDVRRYCEINKDRHEFFLTYDNAHRRWKESSRGILCRKDGVYSIPDFEPGWEALDVDEEGKFTFKGTSFYWWSWSIFLTTYSDEFKDWGGWHYVTENKDFWSTLKYLHKGNKLVTRLNNLDEVRNTRPCIPKQIMFWRVDF